MSMSLLKELKKEGRCAGYKYFAPNGASNPVFAVEGRIAETTREHLIQFASSIVLSYFSPSARK